MVTENVLEDGDNCVLECGPNTMEEGNKCIPCDGPCPKREYCKTIKDNSLKCTSQKHTSQDFLYIMVAINWH